MQMARGFSIVELLIAMVLGSIVIIGIVQLFVANSATYKVLVGQSRMQESARFSLEFIGRDVRRAGYRVACPARVRSASMSRRVICPMNMTSACRLPVITAEALAGLQH